MTTALWIDTDMGFDDLAAIGLCLAEGREVAGLSLVAGNVGLDQAVANACAAATVFGWTMPIHAGAEAPLSGDLVTAEYVLGGDGMPTVGMRLPQVARDADSYDGVGALAAWIEGGGREVLAVGPLTNLAHLVVRHPELVPMFTVTWMGGAFARGNHTAVAEFNAAVDPEAIDILIKSGVDLVMVGLECCREVTVGLSDIPRLREISGPHAQLLGDLYEGYVRIADEGRRPMALYDPVAAVLALDPELAELTPVHMEVELTGEQTRGMTVIEWRAHKAAPNIRVAQHPARHKIRARFHAALHSMAKGRVLHA